MAEAGFQHGSHGESTHGMQDVLLRQEIVNRRRQLVAVPDLAHREDIRGLLKEVDDALARLDGGTYGICESCHEPMEANRVLADPLARVCLGCLSDAEARALERDLEMASAIQARLLPERMVRAGGWEIRHQYRPFGPVSGDHCDVLLPGRDGGPLHFMLGDVSGKGIPASLLMSNLHAILRSLVPLGLPLDTLVQQANRLFCESTLPSSFATLVAGRLTPSGTLELVNAGHCSPLLLRGGDVSSIPTTALPLGMFCNASAELHRVELEPEDMVLVYTDGLSEAENAAGEPYGSERLQRLLGRLGDRSPAAAISACLEDLGAFLNGVQPGDDLTVMAIRRE